MNNRVPNYIKDILTKNDDPIEYIYELKECAGPYGVMPEFYGDEDRQAIDWFDKNTLQFYELAVEEMRNRE